MQLHFTVIMTLTALWVSELHALEVDADFTGGSVGAVNINTENRTILFTAQKTVSDQESIPAYWYFRVKDVIPNQPLHLESEPLNAHPKTFMAVSEDRGANWTLHEAVQSNGKLQCTLTPSTETLLIASTPPLSSIKLLAELTEISRNLNGVEWISPENADGTSVTLPILRISEGDRVDARRFSVWIQSLPKTSTQNSNWVLLGLTKWLFSADTAAVWLRQNAEIYISVSESYTPSNLHLKLQSESRFRVTLTLNSATSNNQQARLSLFPELGGVDALDKAIAELMPVKMIANTLPSQPIDSSLENKITLDMPSWTAEATPEKAQRIGEILGAFISKELEASPPP